VHRAAPCRNVPVTFTLERMRTAAVWSSIVAGVVVGLALLLGATSHAREPIGVFLYTPRNWCESRTNAFGLVYGAVVLIGALISTLVWVVLSVWNKLKRRAGLSRVRSQTAAVVLALLLAALALTPVVQLAFPLKPDPQCAGKSSTEVRQHAP
jgi:uncharacterized protein YacL